MSEASIAAGIGNLIPAQKGDIRARLNGQKGGLARTQAKIDAARFAALKARMKKLNFNEEDAKWMIQKLENRDLHAADVLCYIEEIKKEVHPAQRVALSNTMAKMVEVTHGAKVKTENVNLNISTTIEEWERRLIGDTNE